MSQFQFGLGSGHLSRKVERAVEKQTSAVLINYREPGGRKRHWFSGPNYGAPFDGNLAKQVDDIVRENATKADRKLLGY